MPATRVYSVQRSRSARTSASQATRSVTSQDRPNSSIRLRTSGAVKASLISPFNCSTISRGVADGTAMPRKPVSSNPGKVAPRRLWANHQVAPAGAKYTDDGEILRRIIGQIAHKADIGRMRAGRDQQHRVAVRLGGLHRHRADDAVGAGAVVDDDRLPGFLLDLLADQARRDVARPSRPKRHDDLDRPGRILGRVDKGRRQRRAYKRENRTAVG